MIIDNRGGANGAIGEDAVRLHVRPERVRRAEPLQPEHPLPSPGQVRGGRAAHPAESNNHDVVRHVTRYGGGAQGLARGRAATRPRPLSCAT